MPVISFVSPKGGAGKTTAALVLATELNAAGHKVTLIDADPNLPLMKWASLPGRPEGLEVIQDTGEATIVATIKAARDRSEFVIIDLEGTASGRVTKAIIMSSLVLIPLQASGLDLDQAARSTMLISDAADSLDREIPYAVLFTRVPAASRIRSRNFKLIAGQIDGNGVAMLQTSLAEREAFKSLFLYGGTLDTLDRNFVPSVATAKANAAEFVSEVIGMTTEARAAA